MRHARLPSLAAAVLLFCVATASAQLAVTVSPVKVTGQKAIVPLAMRNDFAESIESARAVVFLLDEQGKAQGQPVTRWVIGGSNMAHLGLDSRIGIFCAGDPLLGNDWDGRLATAYANYQYNGGAAGEALRGLAGLYNQFGASTESTYLAWNAYNTGVDRSANVMAGELANGSGWTWTAAQGVSSIVGDFVGYNNAYEAGFGVDRQSMTLLNGVDRTSRGFMAVSQMAGTTATLGAMYNPSATFFTQPVPPVAANAGRWTQLEFDFVDGLNAQRQGYGPLPAGESPYQLTLFPDAPYDRVTFYGNSPTAAQRAAAAPYSFDHDPALVMHYWEGDGRGGLPGFNLTQTERLQQAQSLNGNSVPRSMQNYQGWQMMNYSAQRNAEFGLSKPPTKK